MADNRKFLQTQKHTLSASISLSDTSIALSSFNMPDGTAIVSGDLGSINYATIEPGTTREESISFTGLTSTTLTGVTRGLRFDSPYTQDTSLRVAHAAGAILVLSNSVSFYDNFVNKNNDETYAETLTFTAPNYPKMDSVTNAPVTDEELASKKYVDDTASGTPVSKDREVIAGNAGETVAAGDWMYLKSADSEWYKTDASVVATSDQVKIGVAQGAGTDGNAISGGVLTSGLDSNQTGLTANTTYFLSDTAGAIGTTAGTIDRVIGIAISTTEIVMDPNYDSALAGNEKDAVVSANGTLSSTNPVISGTGLQRAQEIFAADAEASDTYVITLSPVPAGYVTGMVINFSANTANTGACTLNVNSLGAKSIKKAHDQDPATNDIESGQIVTVIYDGTNFQMQSQTAESAGASAADVQTFTSSGTWTKPSGAPQKVLVQAWGAAASGGKGNANNGGGGGGGLYVLGWFEAGDLGATETVTVGTGGAAVSSAGSGNTGGDTTFGSFLTADGGGGGGSAAAASVAGGNGGKRYANLDGLWGTGVSDAAGQSGTESAAGGGTNNGSNLNFAGGDSEWGGAGGGGSNVNSGGAAAGGTSTNGGNGGAGNINGNATAGTQPGGGGGGNSGTGNSGAGADGQVIVTTIY